MAGHTGIILADPRILDEKDSSVGDTYDTGLLGTRAFFAGHGGRLGRLHSHRPEPGLEDNLSSGHDDFTTQAELKSCTCLGGSDAKCSDAVPPTRTLGISTTTPEHPRVSAQTQALCGRQALYDDSAFWSHKAVKAPGFLVERKTGRSRYLIHH